mmetsp:Transcript_41269/g.80931  ORF Transcript_41269/g.80931 Transcript_41269/m.80931 type:complete len:379 (+) Transcript_41269:102-1238(+)
MASSRATILRACSVSTALDSTPLSNASILRWRCSISSFRSCTVSFRRAFSLATGLYASNCVVSEDTLLLSSCNDALALASLSSHSLLSVSYLSLSIDSSSSSACVLSCSKLLPRVRAVKSSSIFFRLLAFAFSWAFMFPTASISACSFRFCCTRLTCMRSSCWLNWLCSLSTCLCRACMRSVASSASCWLSANCCVSVAFRDLSWSNFALLLSCSFPTDVVVCIWASLVCARVSCSWLMVLRCLALACISLVISLRSSTSRVSCSFFWIAIPIASCLDATSCPFRFCVEAIFFVSSSINCSSRSATSSFASAPSLSRFALSSSYFACNFFSLLSAVLIALCLAASSISFALISSLRCFCRAAVSLANASFSSSKCCSL